MVERHRARFSFVFGVFSDSVGVRLPIVCVRVRLGLSGFWVSGGGLTSRLPRTYIRLLIAKPLAGLSSIELGPGCVLPRAASFYSLNAMTLDCHLRMVHRLARAAVSFLHLLPRDETRDIRVGALARCDSAAVAVASLRRRV